MQHLLTLFLLLCALPALASHANGNDDSLKASYTASCNASFQEACHDEAAELIASDSLAAPIGALGNSAIEFAMLVLATGVFVMRRKRTQSRERRAAQRKNDATHSSARETLQMTQNKGDSGN